MLKIPWCCKKEYISWSCMKEYISLCCKNGYVLQFLSDWLIHISLTLLLTSYDVSPWLCFSGPSSITYTKATQDVDLEIPNSVITYQKIAPILSLILGAIGWVVGMAILEDDEDKDEDKK